MMDTERTTVEDFAIKGLSLAKMTGVSAAVHAIKDAFLLQHTGVGCKYKAAAQLAQHDWASHPNKREAWTQVGEVSLIKGAATRIGPFARTWWERRRPGLMVVVTAYFIELTGDDTSDYVKTTEATLPCPMVTVKTAGPNGGFYDGYASVMYELIRLMDWKKEAAKPRRVTILGHFFHRYEMDQVADVQQLQSLIRAVDLEPGPILFSGRPWAELEDAHESGVVVQLPNALPVVKKLRRQLKKRQVVSLDLPMGIAGTSRFLRELGAATGADPARIEARIERHIEAITVHMGHIGNHRMRELHAWVFADTPQAAGIVTILRELGVPVQYVGLRDTVLGGRSALLETLSKNRIDPGDAEIVERPSLYQIQQEIVPAVLSRRGALVIGSSHELAVFTRDTRLTARSDAGVMLLETGLPSNNYHAAYAAPSLGFQGVLAWTQRLLDASLRSSIGGQGG